MNSASFATFVSSSTPLRGGSIVSLLVILFVPLFWSFLAMPGLCCFLRVPPLRGGLVWHRWHSYMGVLHRESFKRLAPLRKTKDRKHLLSTPSTEGGGVEGGLVGRAQGRRTGGRGRGGHTLFTFTFTFTHGGVLGIDCLGFGFATWACAIYSYLLCCCGQFVLASDEHWLLCDAVRVPCAL